MFALNQLLINYAVVEQLIIVFPPLSCLPTIRKWLWRLFTSGFLDIWTIFRLLFLFTNPTKSQTVCTLSPKNEKQNQTSLPAKINFHVKAMTRLFSQLTSKPVSFSLIHHPLITVAAGGRHPKILSFHIVAVHLLPVPGFFFLRPNHHWWNDQVYLGGGSTSITRGHRVCFERICQRKTNNHSPEHPRDGGKKFPLTWSCRRRRRRRDARRLFWLVVRQTTHNSLSADVASFFPPFLHVLKWGICMVVTLSSEKLVFFACGGPQCQLRKLIWWGPAVRLQVRVVRRCLMKNDDTGIRRGNKVKLFTDQGWRKGRILWGSPSILLEWKMEGSRFDCRRRWLCCKVSPDRLSPFKGDRDRILMEVCRWSSLTCETKAIDCLNLNLFK